jgi:hypothetical protein
MLYTPDLEKGIVGLGDMPKDPKITSPGTQFIQSGAGITGDFSTIGAWECNQGMATGLLDLERISRLGHMIRL